MDELGCRGGRGRGTLMSVCREQMMMSVNLSSYGLNFNMVAKVCWTAPWTSKCTDVCCNKVSYPGQEPTSKTTLFWSKIMLRPTQPEPLGISSRTRTWKWYIGRPKVRIWTHSTDLWPGGGPIFQLLQHNCVWLCSRPGLLRGLSGLRLCYKACRLECVLSSLRVVVTPTINQPSTMPLISSTDLQN